MNKIHKLWRILKIPAYRSVLARHGVAAGVEHEPVLRSFSFQTIVDIGANRGQFALAARQCVPNAAIISFEPLAEPAQRFKKIFDGDKKVILYEVALGTTSGDATIHISNRDDSSSLLAITPLQSRLFPGTSEADTAVIRIGVLSDYIHENKFEAPALLKLDVQGFELETLKGCEPLLKSFTHIYVECSFFELYAGQAQADEVISWLHARNFSLAGIYNSSYDFNGIAVQADFLFKKQNGH